MASAHRPTSPCGTRYPDTPSTTDSRSPGASLASEGVLALVREGSTLVLQGLHRLWPPLIEFTGDLAADLGHPVQVNAYVTPAQSQGFAPHYDVHDVFGYTFVSPDEYHYLFGAATDEVLDDSCPTEWIGTRVTTGLGGDRRIRVVPDRLTYLTAARSLPSRIITGNWARGQHWRAAFETGIGVTAHAHGGDSGLVERLGQRRNLQVARAVVERRRAGGNRAVPVGVGLDDGHHPGAGSTGFY